MNTIGGFIALVRDELGLDVSAQHVEDSLGAIPGRDSLHILNSAARRADARRPAVRRS